LDTFPQRFIVNMESTMNIFLRTLLFASSLAPAVLISALAHWYTAGSTAEVFGWVAASGLTCLLPALAMIEAGRRTAVIPFKAKKIESQDWLLFAFIASYFVPLVTKVGSLEILACIFVIAAVLLATLEAIPAHPVLHLCRYRFYKVEGENGIVYTMITRRRILKASDIKTVKQLSPQLLLDN
jgi:hypothetical protein